MMERRFVVKMVTMGSPAWSGTVWTKGCKHLASAEALFARKVEEVESGDALLLIDRERRKVLRSVGSSDPEKTAAWFGW
jgi:hypothetical protein